MINREINDPSVSYVLFLAVFKSWIQVRLIDIRSICSICLP
ncbi:MAG: hypothetical protein OFPII_08640 [Osedax symbiont Rs1]|nr:MAG: hypothetical protein OFPII_08640 [Osedax symbiont Rs1]